MFGSNPLPPPQNQVSFHVLQILFIPLWIIHFTFISQITQRQHFCSSRDPLKFLLADPPGEFQESKSNCLSGSEERATLLQPLCLLSCQSAKWLLSVYKISTVEDVARILGF